MSGSYSDLPNGYLETIRKGLEGARRFRGGMTAGTLPRDKAIARLGAALREADAVLIGAGAGLSTAAGLTYSGERFDRYFFDFRDRFGITDMYSGGFYPFPDEETRWAWWARHIFFNRYVDPPRPVYRELLGLTRDRDFFVITTNVDHQFQRAGFDKKRLFYTQGDYGLFQGLSGRDGVTYDNEAWVRRAMAAQGFVPDGKGGFLLPDDRRILMRIPRDMIPKTPSGDPVRMNLRSDDRFAEDAGWHAASAAYARFLERTAGKRVLFLEIGVGMNTPVIIKYPFWQMTAENPRAVYACLNHGEAYCPEEIADRSVCVPGDSAEAVRRLLGESGG